MELKTLKTFHMIVKYGSFIRAAEEMNYVQSTVTMQIQKLEAELGVQLMERGERGKKIRLTEAGRLFYEESLPIVKNMEQLQKTLTELQFGERGHIRLGVTEPTASYRLPRILKGFLTEFPQIHISVEIANTPTLSKRVFKGDIDLALCTSPSLGSDLYFEPLFHEDFVVLMPQNHPLSGQTVIRPEDLWRYRLLITSEICPYRRKLEMVLQESGITPTDTMEIGSMTALKYYVESGLGIALVPEIVLKTDPPKGTVVRTISGSLIQMTSGVLLNPKEYPLKRASARFYQYLKQELLDHDHIGALK